MRRHNFNYYIVEHRFKRYWYTDLVSSDISIAVESAERTAFTHKCVRVSEVRPDPETGWADPLHVRVIWRADVKFALTPELEKP